MNLERVLSYERAVTSIHSGSLYEESLIGTDDVAGLAAISIKGGGIDWVDLDINRSCMDHGASWRREVVRLLTIYYGVTPRIDFSPGMRIKRI